MPAGLVDQARRVPVTPPVSLINQLSLKAFNTLYFHRQRGDVQRSLQHYRPFFYPLDALLGMESHLVHAVLPVPVRHTARACAGGHASCWKSFRPVVWVHSSLC